MLNQTSHLIGNPMLYLIILNTTDKKIEQPNSSLQAKQTVQKKYEKLKRPQQITRDFLSELDKHLEEIVSNKTDIMLDIRDFAKILSISPRHLSNTIKQTTGKAPCDFCEAKILEIAKKLLQNSNLKISNIAIQLTYDPSNFTKFFKKYSGQTPTEYRNVYFQEHSETVTIKTDHTKSTFA